MAGWRTGCGIVRNLTSTKFQIYFPLPQVDYGEVDPQGTYTFRCSPIFWECHDVPAIREMATRFQLPGTGPGGGPSDFFMFMDEDTYIMWTPMRNPSYDNRQMSTWTGRYYGCVDVDINERGPGDYYPWIWKEW